MKGSVMERVSSGLCRLVTVRETSSLALGKLPLNFSSCPFPPETGESWKL